MKRMAYIAIVVLALVPAYAPRAGEIQAVEGTEDEIMRDIQQALIEGRSAAESSPGEHQFRLSVYQQYDTNPLRLPGSPADGKKRYDFVTVVRPSYTWLLRGDGDAQLSLHAAGHASLHVEHSEINLFGFTFGAQPSFAFHPLILTVPISGGIYSLKGDPYALLAQIEPRLIWDQHENFAGNVYVGARRMTIMDDTRVLLFAPSDRTANVLSAGMEEWYMFGEEGAHRVKAGLLFETQVCEDHEWNSRRVAPYVAYEGKLPYALSLNVRGEYAFEMFPNENANFGGLRQHTREYRGDLSIGRPWNVGGGVLTTAIGITYEDSDSNADSEDYKRLIATFSIGARF